MTTPYRVIEGHLVATEKRFAVVVSRWNHLISDRLLEGALDTISRHGGDLSKVTVVKVPGAFELPMISHKLAATGDYDAVVALGVLIRGATPHFDYISAQSSGGLMRAGMETGVPVSFGVITVDSIEQALERAGTKAGNKGAEATLAAIEMANVVAQI